MLATSAGKKRDHAESVAEPCVGCSSQGTRESLAVGSRGHALRYGSSVGAGPAPMESLEELQGLLSWLRAEGAELDGLCFRRDCRGGMGVFAARTFSPGDVVATIPQRCILTAELAKSSELGVAAFAAASEWGCRHLCTDEVLLWIFMCAGRASRSHPFHAYLSALPETSPEPVCWPKDLRDELRQTPVGAAVDVALREMQLCFDQFVSRLPERLPHLLPDRCLGSVHALLWARGMCFSRAYNAQALFTQAAGQKVSAETVLSAVWVGDKTGGDVDVVRTHGKAQSVLLPLFDLLNHRAGQNVTWTADDRGVRFQIGERLKLGDEVFNDYGARSNEDLLFAHGFCLRDNPMDAVALWMQSQPQCSSTRTRFMLRRRQEGGVPSELWRLLASAQAAEDPARDSDEQVVVGVKEVMLLAQALQEKLQHDSLTSMQGEDWHRLHFTGPPADDYQAKRLFVAMYRQGQRDVLREALASLAELLDEAPA